MVSVEECISERECRLYGEGLNTKIEYMFSKNVGLVFA